jgi:copper chaperone NosL
MRTFLLAAGAALLLAGCSSEKQVEIPQPIVLTADSVGHFCQMTVLDHPGPKAQVHLEGEDAPLWFSQVRDALAFDRMPEEPGEVLSIYVNDMANAASWDEPGVDNWIEISTAVFVIDSGRRGGMGAPELVPFSTQSAANEFAHTHGGRVVNYSAIEDDMVLAPIEVELLPENEEEDSHGEHGEAHG